MRYLLALFLLAIANTAFAQTPTPTVAITPTSSPTPTVLPTTVPAFSQGFYEFETTVGSMSYIGAWSTVTTLGVPSRFVSGAGSSVQFWVTGARSVVIWRLMRQSAPHNGLACVNGVSCIVVNADGTQPPFWHAFVLTMPNTGINSIEIIWQQGGVNLDSFMVLADASVIANMPTPQPTSTPMNTPVPTATAISTSTPMNTPVDTATAAPTSTPQPTATPYTLPGAIVAIDPAARYGNTNGQITSTRYGMAAPDYVTVFLLVVMVGGQFMLIGVTLWKRK